MSFDYFREHLAAMWVCDFTVVHCVFVERGNVCDLFTAAAVETPCRAVWILTSLTWGSVDWQTCLRHSKEHETEPHLTQINQPHSYTLYFTGLDLPTSFINHWKVFELFAPRLTLPPPCALKNHHARWSCCVHFHGSSDAGHELPRTIKSKAIFALILTEGYFGG